MLAAVARRPRPATPAGPSRRRASRPLEAAAELLYDGTRGHLQGLYTEMKFERPSRIQALTLPMILTPPYRSLIAQVSCGPTTDQPLSLLHAY